jgi:SAM-dependent methyltransferase
MDAILAAHRVGEQGGVIGIDLSPRMIERARQAVAEAGLQDRGIDLRAADMEGTQLPDSFADVVISNCVINLSPDKDAVYNEAFRILQFGGRLAVSDIVLTAEIDSELRARFQSTWTGCLGGAVPEGDHWQAVRKAGFAEIVIGEEFTPPPAREDLLFVEGKVSSVKFTAVKPLPGWEADAVDNGRKDDAPPNTVGTRRTGNWFYC